MRVLVLGGSNLIGPALVSGLLEDRSEVTIATRGITPDPFGDAVNRVKIERSERGSLRTLAALGPWDVICDQICYTGEEAEVARESFAGRVGRYILTSTIMVYAPAPDLTESAFDPYEYRANSNGALSALPPHLRYAEGKRAAEATFFQQTEFPVAAARFPNILGVGDRSRRLDWHVNAVRKHQPIFTPSPDVRQSLVWSRDAGRFLRWLGSHSYTGPINAASTDPISVGDLLEVIAAEVGSPVVYARDPTERNYSPFGFSEDFTIDTQLVEALGFEFTKVAEWLPILVREQVVNGPRRSRDEALHRILHKLHCGETVTAKELEQLDARLESLRTTAHRTAGCPPLPAAP